MCHIATLMYGLGIEASGLFLGKKVLFTSLPHCMTTKPTVIYVPSYFLMTYFIDHFTRCSPNLLQSNPLQFIDLRHSHCQSVIQIATLSGIKVVFLCRKLHLFLRNSTETAATRAALFDSNMHQIVFWLGLRPFSH